MKIKTILFSTSIILIGFSAKSQDSKKQEDIKAIKSMCGCYEVKFNFSETFNYSKDSINYKPSKTKHDSGLEWVELLEDQPNKIALQHLLIVGEKEDDIVKHWRQDWEFENTNFYEFYKDLTWKFKTLSKKEVKGQWTQKVYQVDDSPRYEGTATWIHADNRHFWQNITDAPLPRREHTIRNDYNVLKRNNTHEITNFGWIHNQDNDKIVRANNQKDFLLAQEKGYDVYTKVDDSKCIIAQNYWKKNNGLWKKLRDKWELVFAKNKDLSLEKAVDNQPLFVKLFSLKPDTPREEINKIIDSYIIK
ncbi:conserved hypothetical protein [Flavobacterium psychrophilum]|uniref:DUF6607 family protein n=1 Tax=Flavobacterium psychrophilum TaxID=96345 RepID=UPI000B7C204B|nr:DUF6607 family protein [Flavobacterium psychrophilum]SNB17073.1 conserved hypothetical protein [Flavobacterium psychrophilum]